MDTTLISSPVNQKEKDLFRTISRTALLTSTLNIAAAITQNYLQTGTGPERMLKTIASGIFGKDALNGGILMITWGLVFHFMIAFLFTASLFLIYPRVIEWIKNKFISGIIYGLFVWAIMNQVVLPLSLIPKATSFEITQAGVDALVLICLTGIPVALIAHKYYSSPSNKY